MQFHNPVPVHFGWGKIENLAAHCPEGPIALVTFPQAESLGLLDRLSRILGPRIAHAVCDTPTNPDLAWLRKTYAAFARVRTHTACLLAVGGGSVIDAAKVLAVNTADGGFAAIEAHLKHGGQHGVTGTMPLIAVPTTAGTGSEVTPWATVWSPDEGAGSKYSLHLPDSWCAAAVIDPELGITLPEKVMRDASLDALSHSFEALWNRNANPVSDALAVAAARAILAHLPAAIETPQNAQHRIALSHAALLAGLAFSNTRTALAHSISYPLTLHHGLSHGLACSFTLPMVWRLAKGADAGRDAVLNQIFGPAHPDPQAALASFLDSVGVPATFAAHGIARDAARQIIEQAFDGARGKNFIVSGDALKHDRELDLMIDEASR